MRRKRRRRAVTVLTVSPSVAGGGSDRRVYRLNSCCKTPNPTLSVSNGGGFSLYWVPHVSPSRCSHDEIEVCFLFVTVQRISIRSEDTLTSWVVVHPLTAPFPFPGSAAFK
ncbi:hypothetical protein BHM03_00005430 [Ensete ventricosum]|nr:hypothetical protein BHM03_00005430 [Ensete ventricosum]